MPAVMTYDSLLLDVQTYAERDDTPFVDQIPKFIALAENRLASESKPLGFLRVVSGNIDSAIMKKPARWRRSKSFSVVLNNERSYLFQRSYEYCRTFGATSLSGTPRFYADYDYEHFYIVPSPSVSMPFELLYYERPKPLSVENQTNWTTQYAPQLLLYASLLEAQPFLKTSERIQEFQGLFDRAIQGIIKEDQERTIDAAG